MVQKFLRDLLSIYMVICSFLGKSHIDDSNKYIEWYGKFLYTDHKKHQVVARKNECTMILFLLGGRSTCEHSMPSHVPIFMKIAVTEGVS